MNTTELKKALESGAFDKLFAILYGEEKEALSAARKRYIKATERFEELFPAEKEGEIRLFSVPGRTEICGNHTDHNRGKCVAGSADCDIIAVACRTGGDTVHVISEGFPGDHVNLKKLTPSDYPSFKSVALCAGLCRAFLDHGYPVTGFCAYTTSNVLKGSGLSSSAAFEVMVGTLLNRLCAEGTVEATELAKYAKWAENVYFGKPCGLLDQTACAVGGYIAMDFEDPTSPKVEPLSFDLHDYGYALCITDTGGSHSDMGAEYASIPEEMKAVAAALGAKELRDTSKDALLAVLPSLRERCGDRAVLRALHYFDENERVDRLRGAMEKGDIGRFLSEIRASGASSRCYLQNVFAPSAPGEQGISLALYTAEQILARCPKPTACRVHGGGFAGTMQAFLPEEFVPRYTEAMNAVFGKNACRPMRVRPLGAVELTGKG